MAAAIGDQEFHVPCMVLALEIYPQIASEVISASFSKEVVATLVNNDPDQKFKKNLNINEKKVIEKFPTDGFRNMDFSMIYKLARYFKLVPAPSGEWGKHPLSQNIGIGDDLERMRTFRNNVLHTPFGRFTEETGKMVFGESIKIGQRIDAFLGKTSDGFENRINNIDVNHVTKEEYITMLEENNELQGRLKNITDSCHVDLYYGNDIAIKIGNRGDSDSADNLSTQFVLHVRDDNLNVSAIIQKLDLLKAMLNNGDCSIKLLSAESGSLILHVEIDKKCFLSKSSLHLSVSEFLRRVFLCTSISERTEKHVIDVILTEEDGYFIADEDDDDDDYLAEEMPSVLKLDVMVKNTTLQDEKTVYQDVDNFVGQILDSSGGRTTNGTPVRVIMTANKDNQNNQDVNEVEMSNSYCGICKVKFTSPKQATDHYGGKGHKRALTLNESDEDTFCNICNVSCSGPEAMQDHKKGKNHRKKQEQLSSPGASPSKLDIGQENVTLLKQTSRNEHFCDLCQIPCSGIEAYNDHLMGQRHMRQEQQRTLPDFGDDCVTKDEDDGKLICTLCNIKVTGTESMFAHLQGRSHCKKKLNKSQDDIGEREEDSFYYDAQSHFDDDDSVRDIESSDDDNLAIEPDETFINNLREAGSQNKYAKDIDYKNNLIEKTEEKNKEKKIDILSEKISNLEIERSSKVTQGSETAEENMEKEIGTSTSMSVGQGNRTDLKPGVSVKQGLADTKKTQTPLVRKPKRQQNYHCISCNALMNTEKAYQDHLQGKQHLKRLLAPERSLPQTVCKDVDGSIVKIKTKPRKYQLELFKKAMQGEAICFLPTGTGKTLIGCMVVSAMLEQNPMKQVIFLVDKGLLVLQQYQYIQRELGYQIYTRSGLQDPNVLEERKLTIARLCAGTQTSTGNPLWRHDVVVATAAYYENLLEKKLMRWQDACLVVFDEAHHCVKSHPYNRLLHFQHREIEEDERPKLLGLTASPAGKSTVDLTINMLQELMENVGGARIEIVEENQDELSMYESNAEIEIKTVSLNVSEAKLKQELQVYLLMCYKAMGDLTNVSDLSVSDELKLSKRSEADIKKLVEESSDADLLKYLSEIVKMSGPKHGSSKKEEDVAYNLIEHTKYMCIVLDILLQFGMVAAIEEFQEQTNIDQEASFEFARKINLPCDKVTDIIQSYLTCGDVQDVLPGNEGKFSKLINLLTSKEILPILGKENALVLILVKERGSAFEIEEHLRTQVDLKVSALVGHGTTSGTEPGMKVSHQKLVLDNIRQHKYSIVVATSVAEEGIDIPECELVITLNPPSNVTALVQMRGRARKLKSKFIVVVNSQQEEKDLNDLLHREANMMEAVKQLAT